MKKKVLAASADPVMIPAAVLQRKLLRGKKEKQNPKT